jgi:putative transposase
MGIVAIYPKRKTSQPHPGHKVYPYLLRGLKIERVNQVWCTDITYIRMSKGWAYLVAVMDWYSRYVLSWNLSTTMETDFCVKALEDALQIARPEIFNSDQGAQFTSKDFTQVLLDSSIKISMDGRGRVFDNIFIERLWRSLKYEEVYINDYESFGVARKGISNYFDLYDNKRLHESLGYVPPVEIYKNAA